MASQPSESTTSPFNMGLLIDTAKAGVSTVMPLSDRVGEAHEHLGSEFRNAPITPENVLKLTTTENRFSLSSNKPMTPSNAAAIAFTPFRNSAGHLLAQQISNAHGKKYDWEAQTFMKKYQLQYGQQ